MPVSPDQTSPSPEFPYWPFSFMSLYSQMARDFGRYAQSMTRCTDTLEAARAEGDFGVRLMGDLMQGYFDLALAPWMAMARVMAGQSLAAPEQAAEVTTLPMRVRSAR